MKTLFLTLAGEGRNLFFAQNENLLQRGLVVVNGYTDWMRLDKQSTLVSDRGFTYDLPIYLHSVTVADHCIRVVYQSTTIEEPTLSSTVEGCSVVQTGDNQVVIGGAVNRPTVLDVQIAVDNSTVHLSLNLFPRESVYDVAIDAGSDASQIMIHNRGDDVNTHRHQIIAGLRRHFQLPAEDYDQQDEDPSLFLSRFYWNSNLINAGRNSSHFGKPNDPTSPLLFITKRSDPDKVQIPAIKVHYLSSIPNNRPWSVSQIYQSILGKFLLEALYSIDEGKPDGRVAVVVHLLVPNIFSQNDHASLTRNMNDFVQSKRFEQLKPEGLDVYVEIRLVSESDASMLGYLEQLDKQPEGRYCVIDMGRGTTDISILDVDAAKATPVSRQGFLGAGNVINMAIFQECVLHFIPVDAYPAKLKKMLSQELAMLWRIELAIEHLKRLNSPNQVEDCDTNADLEPDKLIEKIEGLNGIPTMYRLLDKAMTQLVEEVVHRVPNKIDIVCLTGRAFLFRPLREKMIAAFQNRAKKIMFDENHVKEVCLLGTLATRKLDANRVGLPMAYDCTRGTAEPSLKERIKERVQIRKGWLKFEKIKEACKILRAKTNGEWPTQREEIPKVTLPQVVDKEQVMRDGKPLTCYGASSRFRIGDVLYYAERLPSEGETRLFFDGAQFYIRTSDNRYLLQKVMACACDQLFLAESLFPYGLKFDSSLIKYGEPQIKTKQS